MNGFFQSNRSALYQRQKHRETRREQDLHGNGAIGKHTIAQLAIATRSPRPHRAIGLDDQVMIIARGKIGDTSVKPVTFTGEDLSAKVPSPN